MRHYRVNYRNGQVSPTMSLTEAQRHATGRDRIERYEPGDAECPGEWHAVDPGVERRMCRPIPSVVVAAVDWNTRRR